MRRGKRTSQRHEPAALTGYRLMWVMVIFDLPVGTKTERRAATRFRHFLLDQGFMMSQFSVYMRASAAARTRRTHTCGESNALCLGQDWFRFWDLPISSMRTSFPSTGGCGSQATGIQHNTCCFSSGEPRTFHE